MFKDTFPLSGLKVEREGDVFTICWDSPDDTCVTIFAGTSPETIDRTRPLAEVRQGRTATITGLDPVLRHYFEVVPEGGPAAIAAKRRVRLEGSVNFRDLGGYETVDGRRVRWGHVFRSDSLARLTDSDQERLKNMGLKLVCDFRSPDEAARQPDRLPAEAGIEYLHLPVFDGEFDPVAAQKRIQAGDTDWLDEAFMIHGYLRNVDRFPETWGTVLRRLAEPRHRPLVFHCTGGKDRAGVCAALVLLALGVPEETVIYDHGLSNVYIADLLERLNARMRQQGRDPEKLKPWFTAPKVFITSLLEHLHRAYGGPEGYLRRHVGLDEETLEALRNQLLE